MPKWRKSAWALAIWNALMILWRRLQSEEWVP